ncbi:MAG: ectonucleotide pyrophosphatase/phosphodiesterase [Bacteroidota bacterium]
MKKKIKTFSHEYMCVPVLFLIFFAVLFLFSCTEKTNVKLGASSLNQKENFEKPYLVLISLDGYRWDYTKRFQPPNILKFIEEGVEAESMLPCFPSKTFPNHYSIATGMYPNNHKLVDNSFFNYEKNEVYRIRDREKVEDGTWYGGTPIWVQATNSGMVTASYFFVGSEADVQGVRPNYYYTYDGSVKNSERVAQVLKWLKMPPKKRPHFIATYFSDMDDIGHRAGPNNDAELKAKILALDHDLGVLFSEIKKIGLPVNIMIVSDHGMYEISTEKYMPIEYVENEELFKAVNNGAIVHIYPNDSSEIDSVYNYLKNKEKNFKVYKTENTPQFEIKIDNKDYGAIQIIPDVGWYFTSQRNIGFKKRMNIVNNGEHGLDPDLKEMHAIFYANGPAFKNNFKTKTVKNIHLYPIMCKILEIEIPENIDGELKELEHILK